MSSWLVWLQSEFKAHLDYIVKLKKRGQGWRLGSGQEVDLEAEDRAPSSQSEKQARLRSELSSPGCGSWNRQRIRNILLRAEENKKAGQSGQQPRAQDPACSFGRETEARVSGLALCASLPGLQWQPTSRLLPLLLCAALCSPGNWLTFATAACAPSP